MGHQRRFSVLAFVLICYVFMPYLLLARASDMMTDNEYTSIKSEESARVKQKDRLSEKPDEHVQSNLQAGPSCKNCKQSLSDVKQQNNDKENRHNSRKGIHLEHIDFRSMHQSTQKITTIGDDSITLPKKTEQLEGKLSESRKKRRMNKSGTSQTVQSSHSEDYVDAGELNNMTTAEILARFSNARRARKEYRQNGQEQSQLKSNISLKSIDNKVNKLKQSSKKVKRKLTVPLKSTMDSSYELTTQLSLNTPVDVYAVKKLNDTRTGNSSMNSLPHIKKIKVNIVKSRKESTFSANRQSQQSFENTTKKHDSYSTRIKDQINVSQATGRVSLQNKSNTMDSDRQVKENKKNTNEHKSGADHGNVNDNKFHEGSNHDILNEDTLVADMAKDDFVSDTEWSNNQKEVTRRRTFLTENKLVRPAAADRLEQRIAPDLKRSYRHLMDHLHGVLRKFFQSLQMLKSYNEEIFNGTRYDIMMGAIEIIEKINEANVYIYDGVISATQFTREVTMKYHLRRNVKNPGRQQEIPLELLKSQVSERNFQPHLDRVYEEQRKLKAEMETVNAMKKTCILGESHLKQVRELFTTSYDRPSIQDMFNYLNASIIRINVGTRMSPQLKQLKRHKMYIDYVQKILSTAKRFLTNSAVEVQKGLRQMQENFNMYNTWRQRKQPNNKFSSQRNLMSTLTLGNYGQLQNLVSQAKKHANELTSQQNILQSILDSPINKAKAVVTRKDNSALPIELKFLASRLKLLMKDTFSSLDKLRIYIGSKVKIIPSKTCSSQLEGSGLDDSDLCEEEEEGSGIQGSDSHKVFATDDEDFTFIVEPVDSTSLPVHSVKQLGVDLANFTSTLLHSSNKIVDDAQNLQRSLAGTRKLWDNTKSSFADIEKSTDIQKDFILRLDDSGNNFQEIQIKIQNISQKVNNLKRFNLDEAVDKAKKALHKRKTRLEVDGKPSRMDMLTNENKDQTEKIRVEGTDKNDKLEDVFSYSGLLKKGGEIISNHANIKLLSTMGIDSCGRIGNHFTYIKNNMSLLRQKVERARQILTTLQFSISKSGAGHIPLSIPQTNSETASLTTSIKICIKPVSLGGTVLFVKGNNSASYGVALADGDITVTAYDIENDDIGSVTMDKVSVTDQWCTLEIKRTGETLTVTAVPQTGNTQTVSKMVTNLQLLQPLPLMAYVGGVPQNLGINDGSWEGCVGELIVNGRELTLFSPSSENNGTTLCTDHCISERHKLSMVFNGNGFARFIRPDRESISLITLKFQTHQKMASLLSVINNRNRFYLTVTMANGALKIESSSPNENIVLLSLNSSLNDGESHFLRIVYKGSKTYPELDGNGETFSVERAVPQILREILDGVLVGAFVSISREFLTTSYRPFIGCISDISINDKRLSLPDAADIHNTFHGDCKDSSRNIWESCWQWTDRSKPLSLGVVENSNRISFLISRDALGPVIHFAKEEKFDLEVTMTSAGIEVSSGDSEGVIVRPEKDNTYFTLITITDDGKNALVQAWDQSVTFSYGGIWGFVRSDMTTPHSVVLGEPRDGVDRMFTGYISQFTIEDRFYDLSRYSSTYNLSHCERPLERILPLTVTDVKESFTCV